MTRSVSPPAVWEPAGSLAGAVTGRFERRQGVVPTAAGLGRGLLHWSLAAPGRATRCCAGFSRSRHPQAPNPERPGSSQRSADRPRIAEPRLVRRSPQTCRARPAFSAGSSPSTRPNDESAALVCPAPADAFSGVDLSGVLGPLPLPIILYNLAHLYLRPHPGRGALPDRARSRRSRCSAVRDARLDATSPSVVVHLAGVW